VVQLFGMQVAVVVVVKAALMKATVDKVAEAVAVA
jgi:hypothetical protein